MKRNKIKICVIGAGPNGLTSVIPFLNNLEKFEVTMISSGSSLFTDDIIKMQNYLKSLNRDQQHKFWEEKKFSTKQLIPKKLFFGKSDVYKNIENDLDVSKKIEFDVSHSLGGLSNVWGANVTGLSNNDLNIYPSAYKLSEIMNKISSIFPISGYSDDIDYKSPYNFKYNKNSLKYCSQANKIMEYYNKYKYAFKNNFRLGYSKLAIETDKIDQDPKNANSGLEMYGCFNNSIFNSFSYIDQIKDKINLIENTLINKVDEDERGVRVYGNSTKNNSKIELYFDKVIIAAGSINTSKLALKLLSPHGKKTLTIKDSQKYFFLYFTLFSSKKDEEKNTIGLSQVFLQTEINQKTFHLQLYHSVLLLRDTINNFFPKSFAKFLIKNFNFILKRIMIGVVYFPEEISNHMEISYNKEKNSFFIKPQKNKNFSTKYIIKIFFKLIKFVNKLKSFPLPIFVKSKIGVSQHFGSSLPPSKNEIIGKTSDEGILYPYKNIYISDCSSLDRIPSTPPTFLSMSNSYRIAEIIVKKS